MTTALERQDDIGWFFENEGSRYRVRAATDSEQRQRPGATVTIVERQNFGPDAGFRYRYVYLAAAPAMAARVIEAGPVCLDEMYFLPNGQAKVHVTIDGKPTVLN
jgi:hypothetical protein